jgi:hypothetical protein
MLHFAYVGIFVLYGVCVYVYANYEGSLRSKSLKRSFGYIKIVLLCCEGGGITPVAIFNLLKPSGNFTYHQV